ncbi:N-acetyltransferase [Vallitalea longa]|uniref:N-acetyltransferase n=1 Tax=Vallitalea longa TaxID=2936439 RepID=A0A9W5YCL5_9FIRM|nr:GNAT family N-acetyltransferase [Vallitalea longa]GKX29454.1 N-acetyltransferase [Vallitalea longa]
MIREVKLSDAQSICDIYNYYITNTVITFEEEIVTTQQMIDKIKQISDKYCFIVYEHKNKVIGYAYASKWRERSAYRFCVESSIYVNKNCDHKGIGTILYIELINRLKKLNYRVIMGVISLPNEPSIKLHEKLGFNKAGHFNKVGLKLGKWIDVEYWQLKIQ